MQLSVSRPWGGAKGGGSRRMFWELVLEDVLGKLAELQCVKIEREWKRRNHKMEKASREPWTENANSTGTMQLREYTPREFWEVFVDDRLSGAVRCSGM